MRARRQFNGKMPNHKLEPNKLQNIRGTFSSCVNRKSRSKLSNMCVLPVINHSIVQHSFSPQKRKPITSFSISFRSKKICIDLYHLKVSIIDVRSLYFYFLFRFDSHFFSEANKTDREKTATLFRIDWNQFGTYLVRCRTQRRSGRRKKKCDRKIEEEKNQAQTFWCFLCKLFEQRYA